VGENKDAEPYLGVGCPMVFQIGPAANSDAPRATTVVRGWRKPSYILLDRPRMGERFAAIREQQPCAVRFVHEGKACAFESMILDWDTRQHNSYCRIGWPASIDVVTFRKFERVKTSVPCTIEVESECIEAVVVDLSLGGCGVRASEHPQLTVGKTVCLSFILPDGSFLERVETIIKNVRTVHEKLLLGCEFVEGQVGVDNDIAFYIKTRLERHDVSDDLKQRILVICEHQQPASMLRRLFEQRGFEVALAGATVDGLARLRLFSPLAVVVYEHQADLQGALTTQMIHKTRGLEGLDVFLFGGNDDGFEQRAHQAGAVAAFPAAVSPVEVARSVLSSVAGRKQPSQD